MARFALYTLLACAASFVHVYAGAQVGEPVALRIMPFGASQTSGVGSKDGAGWRKYLFDHLIAAGHNVSMVGTQSGGNITAPNNAYEAFPGQIASHVYKYALADGAFDLKPNLIIMTLGTNDCIQSVANTYNDSLISISQALEHVHEVLPSTLTLVAQLVPWLGDKHDCINTFNKGIAQAVAQQKDYGQLVEIVNLHDVLNITTDYQSDGVHPTEEGYMKLAATWLGAVQNYMSEILPPV